MANTNQKGQALSNTRRLPLTCSQCHQPSTYADGTPTQRHDVASGYFGLSLCDLARCSTEDLRAAQEADYRRHLTALHVLGGQA